MTTNEFRRNYWREFIEYLHKSGSVLNIPINPSDRSEQRFAIGQSKFYLYGMIKISYPQITVELYIKDQSKTLFKRLEGEKEAIERDIGERLNWMLLPGQKFSRIVLINDADPKNKSQRDEQFAWLKENLEKFNDVFGSTRY